MVSLRCKMLVKAELERLNLHYTSVELGFVIILENIDETTRETLRKSLLQSGLELLEDQKSVLIQEIKGNITEMIFYDEDQVTQTNAEYISRKLNQDYNQISNIFSEVTGTTIQQYIITQKIERVKELLLYDKLSVTEISYKLNYSSPAHLSNQFKKITGLTPGFFKHLKKKKTSSLDV